MDTFDRSDVGTLIGIISDMAGRIQNRYNHDEIDAELYHHFMLPIYQRTQNSELNATLDNILKELLGEFDADDC